MSSCHVGLPGSLLRDAGARITAVSPGRIELLAIDEEPSPAALARVEVVVKDDFASGTDLAVLVRELPSLRWLHAMSSGTDDLPAAELERAGCLVTSSAGLFSPQLTEYVLGAMVLLARRLPDWHACARERRWAAPGTFDAIELRGSRVGIVGYGSIGRSLGRVCQALGMEVWATRRTPRGGEDGVDRLLRADELPALLAAADFVVLTASLSRGSRGLIGERELRTMRRGASLVNVGRGALVDEEGLRRALADGHLRGAAIDVATVEPLPPDSPLWDTPNLWITPHIAGDTPGLRERAHARLCDNLAAYLAGRTGQMEHVVSHGRSNE